MKDAKYKKVSVISVCVSKKLTLLTDTVTAILSSRKSGFTLLEIMIALVVIGGLLVTLIYTLNYNLGLVQKHETITVASLLAKGKIDETGSISEKIKGSFSEPYSDYSYEIEMDESPYPGVSEPLVTVRRDREKVVFSKLVESPRIQRAK